MSDTPESNPPGVDPLESVRPYLAMASGILGISAAKAAELAQGLWTQGGDAVGDVVDQGVQAATTTGEQVAALLSPEQVRALVREEVDRVVEALDHLIEMVQSENIKHYLEEAASSIYYLVYEDESGAGGNTVDRAA